MQQMTQKIKLLSLEIEIITFVSESEILTHRQQ